MVDRVEEEALFIAPENVEVSVTPSRSVALILGHPHESLGFAPEIVLAVELSPVARLLAQKAAEAEGGPPQQH